MCNWRWRRNGICYSGICNRAIAVSCNLAAVAAYVISRPLALCVAAALVATLCTAVAAVTVAI